MSGFNEWHLAFAAPWSRTALLLATAATLLILWLQFGGARRLSARAWLLLGLRIGGVVLAWALFVQPTLRLAHVTRTPNRMAILVDGSASMGLRERADLPTRAERTAARIARAAPDLARLRQEHAIDFYTFGSALSPASETTLAQTIPARAPASELGEALEALRLRYPDHNLGGVLVLSDGIDTGRLGHELPLDAANRALLAGLDVPIHAVSIGEPDLHDLSIPRLVADDFAFAHNVVKIEAVVRAQGTQSAGWIGRRLPVTLKRDTLVIKTTELVLTDRPEQRAVFEFTPDRVGHYLYEVSIPVLAGEAITSNNTRPFVLRIVRDKIRVLQVAGRPSWDERFLRSLLKHDPNVDLISFFILRNGEDLETVSPDELSLIPFPTEELFKQQLRSFDVVFLQNFNYAPYGMSVYLPEIKRYVEEGGGLAMIGGDLSFSTGGYAHTPVAEVLPIELLDEGSPEAISLAPFSFRPTSVGRSHPITALSLDPQESGTRWQALPPLEGANGVARARPGAQVLAVHPTLKGSDGQPMPILSIGEFGKGRSLAFGSDSSWRWGFGAALAPSQAAEVGQRAYQRFWENAIRWLIHDPELRLLRVESDRTEYTSGERVKILLKALGPDYRPARQRTVVLTVARIGPGGPPLVRETLRTDDEGAASYELPVDAPGGYRLLARVPGGDAALHDEAVLVVRAAGRELDQPEARPELLRAVAEATGGRFLRLSDGWSNLNFRPPRIARIDREHDIELWSTGWSLVLAALFFFSEWALRRLWGLP